MHIDQKVAVITGASKGIGKATALALARENAKLAICARSADLIKTTAEEIKSLGAEVIPFAGDIKEIKIIESFLNQTVTQFGRIDILINNAGLGYFKNIADLPIEEWDEMFNINIRSIFIMTQKALPYLRESKESVVVNVASLAGKNSFVGGGGYAATKHALVGFSRCLMLEERGNGLRVLTLCPGSVDTNFFDGHHNKEEIKKKNILNDVDIADTIVNMIKMPQHALISEIDIRPTNPE